MPELYVMFSHTNTGMGRMIRAVTKSSYNHVSISLHPDLAVCYSFARRNKYNALAGGFVAEDAGRLCDEGDIRVRVCRVPVSQRQFDAARNLLTVCRAQPGRTIYNTYGAMASVIGFHLALPGAFTCVEFVSRCLGLRVIQVQSLLRRLEPYAIYEGSYLEYTQASVERRGDYFRPLSAAAVLRRNAGHFGDLSLRLVCKACGKI